MKVLGRDSDGGAIVALTRGETDALIAVQEVVKGRGWGGYDNQLEDRDVETMFYLIRGFAQARFMIHEFEQSTARLKEWLLTVEGGRDE